MADSIFDPLSNLTLILCNRAVNRVDPRRFPSGKARIENAGNISFCFLMISVSLILIVMSIKTLTDGNGGLPTTDFHVRFAIDICLSHRAFTDDALSSHQPSSSPSPSQPNSASSCTALPCATLTARSAFSGKTTGTISSSTDLVLHAQCSAPKSAGGLIPWAPSCCPFLSCAYG